MDGSSKLSPLEDALAFIEEQDSTYTEEALRASLVDAGYPNEIINEAMRLHDEGSAPQIAERGEASEGDLRGRAASYLVLATVAAWAACAVLLWLSEMEDTYGLMGIALVILAAVLGLVLLISLLVVGNSGSLKRGAQGSMWAILIAPVVILFGLAGTCVVIMTGGTG